MGKNAILFVLIVTEFVGIGYYLGIGEDNHPCAADKLLGQCYKVEREVCNRQLEKFSTDCQTSIEGLKLPPGRLTGPIHERCIQSKFDKIFKWKKGDINLITGYGNHGKTFFWLQVMLTKSIFDGWKWAIFSPENFPANDFYDDLYSISEEK